MKYIGAMIAVDTGIWSDPDRQRRLAHAIFGTPLDTRTVITEPHGLLWAIVGFFFPNLLHIWLDEMGPTP